MSEEREHKTLAPSDLTSIVDSHTPVETLRLAETAGVAKARLSWIDLSVKSFLAGVFISLGAGFDIMIAGGAPGLRQSNPSMATLISALTFPIGFVIIILTNTELCTSNMFVMPYSTLRRRTSVYDLARNWIVSYIFNIAGCLFYAGILFYWADVLTTEAQTSYAITQAEGRVNANWGYNVSKGIMCNWLVALAFFFSTQGRDNMSKIIGIWITIACFVAMGYQHSIANFFLVPIGMFYGTNFGVGKFIWASVIPVTIGNIIGGAFFGSFAMWTVYGRHEPSVRERQDDRPASKV
jgi:formate/nitrite transporter